ncbi:MAG TPA: hypothetical protein VFY33_05155, partial [Solirubrobacterales bacterium]|nr:hypothetical protein [Solirubrobacterales bacterium]
MATRPKGEAKNEGAGANSAATKNAAGSTADGAPDSERQRAAMEEDLHRYIAPVVGPDDERAITDSGIEIK